MAVLHFCDIPEETSLKGATGVSKRTLIGKDQSAPNFYLRRFRVEPLGNTPRHAHQWEHEIYVLSGSGEVMVAGETSQLNEGTAAFIPGGADHQIRAGDTPLEFICIIPAIEEA